MKKTVITEWRIVIEPDLWVIFDNHKEKLMQDKCETIIEEINRHVNDVSRAYIEHELEETCEHCGEIWETESNDEYNGGCCDKDKESS